VLEGAVVEGAVAGVVTDWVVLCVALGTVAVDSELSDSRLALGVALALWVVLVLRALDVPAADACTCLAPRAMPPATRPVAAAAARATARVTRLTCRRPAERMSRGRLIERPFVRPSASRRW
jgi:hypothetical protein